MLCQHVCQHACTYSTVAIAACDNTYFQVPYRKLWCVVQMFAHPAVTSVVHQGCAPWQLLVATAT